MKASIAQMGKGLVTEEAKKCLKEEMLRVTEGKYKTMNFFVALYGQSTETSKIHQVSLTYLANYSIQKAPANLILGFPFNQSMLTLSSLIIF